jgi:hypothetical protein
MMDIENVAELPWGAAMPARKQSKWLRFIDRYRAYKRLRERHGDLVPQVFAAKFAGVSKQRIGSLCDAGNLVRVYFEGHAFITEDSLVAWARSDRKTGDRYSEMSRRQIWKMSVEASAEIVGKK